MLKVITLYRKHKFAQDQNEQGFTLLEVLISLSIFMTIVFYIAPVFQLLLNNKSNEVRLQEMEWQVFCSQIKKEIHVSSKAEVVAGRLLLTTNNELIYIEQYGNILRRRVNSTGHETLLQNVSEVNFIKINNSVKIIVKDIWGQENSVIVQSYINWGPA